MAASKFFILKSALPCSFSSRAFAYSQVQNIKQQFSHPIRILQTSAIFIFMDLQKIIQDCGLKATEQSKNYLNAFAFSFGSQLVNRVSTITDPTKKINKQDILVAYELEKGISNYELQRHKEQRLEKAVKGVNSCQMTPNQLTDPALTQTTIPKNSLSVRLPRAHLTHPLNSNNYTLSFV